MIPSSGRVKQLGGGGGDAVSPGPSRVSRGLDPGKYLDFGSLDAVKMHPQQ